MSKNASNPPSRKIPRRDVVVASLAGTFVAAMVGLSYAAVPLYDWFCRTTGFGGTTQVSTGAPGRVLDRVMRVRFDANVAPGLPWRLVPERNTIDVKIGEVVTVHYTAINQSARETTGIASYNVTPLQSGGYFNKINCFCFSEQTLKAGERQEWAVVFYIDPSLADNPEQDGVNTITLSYTAFPLRQPEQPMANSVPAQGRT